MNEGVYILASCDVKKVSFNKVKRGRFLNAVTYKTGTKKTWFQSV
jgi:hypothetical protein